jgi:cobalt/nickel transport system permease protein
MHIMEGFLPVEHAVGWTVASAPFVAYGIFAVKKRICAKSRNSACCSASPAAFTFVLSALKLPSVTGSCSHPTGTGLGAILFGPAAMAPIGLVVLLFQALLLAHGGLTTLGANVFSMAIVGPFAAFCPVPSGASASSSRSRVSVFIAASVADLLTYVTTSAATGLGLSPTRSGRFCRDPSSSSRAIFAITQIPLAISEGLLTVLICNALKRFNAPGNCATCRCVAAARCVHETPAEPVPAGRRRVALLRTAAVAGADRPAAECRRPAGGDLRRRRRAGAAT